MTVTNIRIITVSLAALAVISSAGCTKPKETTAVGTAAGTAIGAGLGAIIGNQTGNAGSGVAIGAVAGAATGALVANALQAQQESVRSQDEAIERQERLLQAQRSEINELRNMNSDEIEKKRIALQRRGPTPVTGYRTASTRSSDSLSTSSGTAMRARMNPKAVTSKPSRASTSTTSKVTAQKPAAATDTKTASAKAAPKREDALPFTESDDTTTADELAGLSTKSDSASCQDAAKEQRAAATAADSSDKLFHLRKALRLCPENAELHHELGTVYASMNRASDAKQEFEEALKADPTFSAAKTSLENLTEQPEERF
jgi:hypothetical protein